MLVAVAFQAIDPPRPGAVFVGWPGGRGRRDHGAELPHRARAVRAARRHARCRRTGADEEPRRRRRDQHRARRGRSPGSTPSSACSRWSSCCSTSSRSPTWRGWSSTARERTRQYANLSWGVLSGLIRTLDERDSRAARHCAAVAAFSRDIAAPRRDVQAGPGVRAHRRAAPRHRQVRALRPRHGARRPARRRPTGAASAAIPTSAPSCCATSASTARSRRSCAPTTSASTAAATRAA